jgi:hypothetical protein
MKKLGLIAAAALIGSASLAASSGAADRSAALRQAYSQRPLLNQDLRYPLSPSLYEFNHSVNGG